MDEFADEFGDDPLNDLLGQDLDALEQQAFRFSTQAPAAQHDQQGRADHANVQDEYESFHNGDDDDEIIDASRNEYGAGPLPAQPALPTYKTALPAYRPPTRAAAARQPNGPSSQSAAPSHKPRGPLQRAQSALAYRPGAGIQAFRPPQINPSIAHTPVGLTNSTGSIDPSNERLVALEAQVQELLLDKQKLQTTIQEANRKILTKSGEIAIVRSNLDKSVQEREHKVAELQHEVAAATERHRAELEQVRRQQEQLTTESRFADHDRVLDKARRRKQPAKADEDVIVTRQAPPGAPPKATTPRANRYGSPGDAFVSNRQSPSRALGSAQALTPRAAERKRKRLTESPVKALSDPQEPDVMNYDEDAAQVYGDGPELCTRNDHATDGRYETLQSFLNRRRGNEGRRTLELLAEHKFPSDTDTAMSTMVYDGIAKLPQKDDGQDYPAALCGIVIGLWQRCLAEKYFPPLPCLSDLAFYMLGKKTEILPSILDDIVPLLQKTADINLIPRFKRSLRKTTSEPGAESEHVDASECIERLVYLITTCNDNDDVRERFWILIRVDFLSMLLRPAQTIVDIMLTCRLLSYSMRHDGFGPLLSDTESQPPPGGFTKAKAEDHLIDRISALLIENPRNTGSPDETYTQVDIAEMRLEVLALIETLSQSDHAALAFSKQNYAIGRLVRCMNDEYHDAMGLLHGWEDRLQVVNQATRLLYHFVYRFADEMDINEKLRPIPGGTHKYLIVLTRLAFSEGSLWGEQIEEDVVDCAHELLEDHVNPEEGEALMAAFQSGGVRR